MSMEIKGNLNADHMESVREKQNVKMAEKAKEVEKETEKRKVINCLNRMMNT